MARSWYIDLEQYEVKSGNGDREARDACDEVIATTGDNQLSESFVPVLDQIPR